MASGLTSAAPIIGAAIDFGSSLGSGIFNINQAKKNRAFQERMYHQQVSDNIRLWNLQNQYNLPENVIARMEKAGMNPLVYFGEGGTALTSSSVAQSANAPSGDSARGDFRTQFGLAAQQAALMKAQIANINADTEQKTAAAETSRQTASNLEYDLMFKRLTKDLDYATKIRNLDLVNQTMVNMSGEYYNARMNTLQNTLSMMQGREYQIKEYNLNAYQVGETIRQGWSAIEVNKLQANAALKQASAAWLGAVTAANIGNAQIGEINQRIFQSRKLFPQLYRQVKLENQSRVMNAFLDFILKGVDISQKQADLVKSKIMTVRSYLGNDSGIGSILAPFQTPIGGVGKLNELYEDINNRFSNFKVKL